jgi:endonuclease/exonuclease/phosphatase family metal-dependent hydrolase
MRLRAATFNLENLEDAPHLAVPLEARLPPLRAMLERLAADIVLLQEVNAQRAEKRGRRGFAALDRLLATTRYETYHRAASGGGTAGGPLDIHNLVILSRLPIVAERQYRHSLVEAPLYRPSTASPRPATAQPVAWDRPILHAEIALAKAHRLHLLDLHLRAPIATPIAGQKESARRWHSVEAWAEGYYISTMKRTGQALEARRVVDGIFAADRQPLILVGGDLNAEAQETPLRTLLGSAEDTGNPGLAGRALVALEERVAPERRYTVRHAGRRVLLDHLLASPALAAGLGEVRILNEDLPDETAPGVAAPLTSYHAPIVAELEIGD